MHFVGMPSSDLHNFTKFIQRSCKCSKLILMCACATASCSAQHSQRKPWEISELTRQGWGENKFSVRIKLAPNCGYRFVSPSPPPFLKGNFAFSGTGKSPSFSGIPTSSTESPTRIHCFPPPGNRGHNVKRNGGPQIGACLILSDFFGFFVSISCWRSPRIFFDLVWAFLSRVRCLVWFECHSEGGVLNKDRLGGDFGPEKKYLAPPPHPNSPQTPSRPAPRLPPPTRETPPPGIFHKKSPPPPPGASHSPFPSPEQKKIKNIRNVHQVGEIETSTEESWEKGP